MQETENIGGLRLRKATGWLPLARRAASALPRRPSLLGLDDEPTIEEDASQPVSGCRVGDEAIASMRPSALSPLPQRDSERRVAPAPA